MISAECGSEHSMNALDAGLYQQSANGKAVAHALGCCDEVGFDAGELVCEELPGSSVARLNFVEDQQSANFFTSPFKCHEERVLWKLNSTNTLDAFNNNGCCFFIDSRQRSDIIHRNERDLVVGIEWRDDLGVVGRGYCAGSTSMKRFFECHD